MDGKGLSPKVTLQALHDFQYRAEANPDLWIRREARFEMDKVRELLGKLVNASADDIVMIMNTTSAMNAIFRSMVFGLGERILHFSTIYNSMESLIKYICDYSNGAVSALTFNVTYPISNDQIVRNFEEFLDQNHDPAHPIRIAIRNNSSSAHQFRLFSAIQLPRRGTMDFSPYMTVAAALKFREDVGGEQAIMSYNHKLAVDGGKYMATVFGTEVLQDEDQIANMIDVRLPINNADNPAIKGNFWIETLLTRFPQVFAPAYKHGGQWWIRISAQIYNDLDDFEVLAKVFTTICNEINERNATNICE